MYKQIKGSFAVEVCFIMPIIIFIIIIFIYMNFILYDVIYIQGRTNKILSKSLHMLKQKVIRTEDEYIIDYKRINSNIIIDVFAKDYSKEKVIIEQEIRDNLQSKLFFCKINKVDIDINSKYLIASVNVESNLNIPIFISARRFNKTIECRIRNHKPEEFIRKVDLFINIVDR